MSHAGAGQQNATLAEKRKKELDELAVRPQQAVTVNSPTEEMIAEAAKARRLHYAQQMQLIEKEWGNGKTGKIRAVLDSCRPLVDEEDLRGFEWYYWDRLIFDKVIGVEGRLTAAPLCMEFGHRLVVAGVDGTIQSNFDRGFAIINKHATTPQCAACDGIRQMAWVIQTERSIWKMLEGISRSGDLATATRLPLPT